MIVNTDTWLLQSLMVVGDDTPKNFMQRHNVEATYCLCS